MAPKVSLALIDAVDGLIDRFGIIPILVVLGQRCLGASLSDNKKESLVHGEAAHLLSNVVKRLRHLELHGVALGEKEY